MSTFRCFQIKNLDEGERSDKNSFQVNLFAWVSEGSAAPRRQATAHTGHPRSTKNSSIDDLSCSLSRKMINTVSQEVEHSHFSSKSSFVNHVN